MEKYKITKDFSTTLDGWNGPLPKGACYGKVGSIVYIAYRKDGKTSFFVRKSGEEKFHGDIPGKYRTIQAIIPSLEEAEFCSFHAKKKQDIFHAKKREESRIIREKLQEIRDIRVCGPREKRPGEFIYRMRPEATYSYDSNGIPCKDWEEEERFFLSREDEKSHAGHYNGLPVFEEAQKNGAYLNKPFEGTRRLPASGAPQGKPQECTQKEGISMDKGVNRGEARTNARVSAKATTTSVKATAREGSMELFNYNQEAHRINKMCGHRVMDPVASL